MSKHTPGPWTVSEPPATLQVLRLDGLPIADVCSDDDQGAADCPIDEAEANARLIAAAPCMLEALESVVATFHDHPDRDEISLAAARAAIAKAKGE